jgi:hypothetical protein
MDEQEHISKVLNQLDHFLSNHPWTEEYEEIDGELIVGWIIGGVLRAYGFRVREIGDWEEDGGIVHRSPEGAANV